MLDSHSTVSMAKRIASDALVEKDSKKHKANVEAPEPTFQSVISELFELDPATDALQEPAKEEAIKEVSVVFHCIPKVLIQIVGNPVGLQVSRFLQASAVVVQRRTSP